MSRLWHFSVIGEPGNLCLDVTAAGRSLLQVQQIDHPELCFDAMDLSDLDQLLVDHYLDQINLELRYLR